VLDAPLLALTAAEFEAARRVGHDALPLRNDRAGRETDARVLGEGGSFGCV